MRVAKEYRGISKRLAIRYLEGLGGQPLDADGEPVEGAGEDQSVAERVVRVEADDWTATVDAEKVDIGPTMQLTEVAIDFEGDEATLDELVPTFSQKAMRAGG
jgi:molybdopterin synthase sulfur carrier subunit